MSNRYTGKPARGLTLFYRESEMQLLEECIKLSLGSDGAPAKVVLIEGIPGMGKTAFLKVFANKAAKRSLKVRDS